MEEGGSKDKMGSTATQIVLDLKDFAGRTVGGFLKEAAEAAFGPVDGRVAKLKESVRMLEEEKKKIEAFKRELPLCMLLLTEGTHSLFIPFSLKTIDFSGYFLGKDVVFMMFYANYLGLQ